ncbi:MAG: hypothetical protein J0M36_00350 [Caulobacterales bacterium]|nr:hypothetical protein [Caulobacterales bacterium]
MTPFLIVLALLALAVGIVLWATRVTPARPDQQRPASDTAKDAPVAPADTAPVDPFASAPPREEPHP